jgi:hypothetical protein
MPVYNEVQALVLKLAVCGVAVAFALVTVLVR